MDNEWLDMMTAGVVSGSGSVSHGRYIPLYVALPIAGSSIADRWNSRLPNNVWPCLFVRENPTGRLKVAEDGYHCMTDAASLTRL
jgi:hypothetical protein